MDKVVVITGASGGIGAAAAERLARDGARVALVARRGGVLAEVAARCGPDARPIVADMSRREEVRRAVDDALAAFGRIDVWINNAGRGITRRVAELTEDDVGAMMRDNVLTALFGIQEVLPHMQARGEGHIINISSMLGRMPLRSWRSAYSGAKHFLNVLTANLREDLQQTHPGIQISLVSPGVVRTDFGRHAVYGGPSSHQLPDSQSAEEVAEIIAGLIASRRPDVYTVPGSHDRVVAYYASLGSDP